MAQTQKYDEMLMAFAGSCGNLNTMLSAFFDFLHRRTDFYVVVEDEKLFATKAATMGFPKGEAERMLLSAFKALPMKKLPPSAVRPAAAAKSSAASAPTSAPSSLPPTTSSSDASSSSSRSEASAPAPAPSPSSVSAPSPSAPSPSVHPPPTSSSSPAGSVPPPLPPLTEAGVQLPNAGNGGTVPSRYTWTQTLSDLTVYLPVPSSAPVTGKAVSCTIKAKDVDLAVKAGAGAGDSPTSMLTGAFPHAVKFKESFWSLESSGGKGGPCVVLHLEKGVKTWWASVLEGVPDCEKIDTSKVDSTQRVDEYDDVTQAAIRKIMFDQQQQRLGLPTSDELTGGGALNADAILKNIPPPPTDDWHERGNDE